MLGHTLPHGFAKSIAFVRGAAILAGWALMLVVFVGFFIGVTGVLGYVAFKMDAVQAEMIALSERQHLDTLTLTKYLSDLRLEVRAKRKTAEK